MNIRHGIPFAAALLLAIAPGLGSAADLVSIYQEALLRDSTYSAARYQRQASQEKLPQGLAGLLPAASAAANTQFNDRTINFRTPGAAALNSQYNSNFWSLSITQPLFRMQNWEAYQQGKIQVALAEAQFVQATQDLMLRVSQAYFDILLAEQDLALARASKAAFAQQFEQAKRNFEVGTATITDANNAKAQFDLSVSTEIGAINTLEVRKEALTRIIARPAPDLNRLSKNFEARLPEPNNMDRWVETAVQAALPVQIAQATVDFQTREVDRNRAAHYPTLDAFASYTDSASGAATNTNIGNDTRSSVVGLSLAIPLYQGGLVNSRVREAIALQDKTRQDLESAKRQASFDTRQAFLGVTNGAAQVRALEQAVLSNQINLDSTRLAQEVGIRTEVDVLLATQQFFQAQRDLANAKYVYANAVLRLKAAAGALTEDDLASVNRWFAP
ncbi:MAG: TolC family outer membrane protein [Burkholderiales bacterium]